MKMVKEKGMVMLQRWKTVLPEIVVSLFLFFTIWGCFSTKDILMSPFLTLFFIQKKRQDFHLKVLTRTYAWFFIICICSFLATTNVFLCSIMNLFIPFFIVCLFTNKFNQKAYFIYCMEFVMLQLIPVSLEELPIRLFTLFYSCIVLTIALYVHTIVIKKKRNFYEVKQGLYHVSCLLQNLALGKENTKVQQMLTSIIQQMNLLIYQTRNLSYMTDGYGKLNFLFMIIFQRFQYIASYFKNENWSEEDKQYLQELSKTLEWIGKHLQTDVHLQRVYKFQQIKKECCMSHKVAEEALHEILDICLYTLKSMETIRLNQTQKSWKIPKDTRKIKNLTSFFKMDVLHTRFALRLSLVLCIGFTLYQITAWEHFYWFPLSAFFMLMPYAEESKKKIEIRMIGTIGGVCLSFVLMSYFQSLQAHFGIIVVITCFMYYVSPNSWLLPMYTTCFAMVFATMSLQLENALILRVGYVALAAIVSWLATYYILPNTAAMQFTQSVSALFDLDVQMVKTLRKAYQKEFHQDVLREYIIHAHLLSNDIQVYMANALSEEEKAYYAQLLPINERLVSELEQLCHYLYRRKAYAFQKNEVVELIFMNFEEMIEEIRTSYTSGIGVSIMSTVDISLLEELDDTMYFHTLAMNCMHTLQHLACLHKQHFVKV